MKTVNLFMAVALTSVFMCSCGSKTTKVFNTPETILLPENIIEEIHMNDDADQITLIPVKSEVLLKDIGETVCYGDYMFMFSSDGATLYELYKDSVIGVLDRQGRGPGEYITLSFCFVKCKMLFFSKKFHFFDNRKCMSWHLVQPILH